MSVSVFISVSVSVSLLFPFVLHLQQCLNTFPPFHSSLYFNHCFFLTLLTLPALPNERIQIYTPATLRCFRIKIILLRICLRPPAHKRIHRPYAGYPIILHGPQWQIGRDVRRSGWEHCCPLVSVKLKINNKHQQIVHRLPPALPSKKPLSLFPASTLSHSTVKRISKTYPFP